MQYQGFTDMPKLEADMIYPSLCLSCSFGYFAPPLPLHQIRQQVGGLARQSGLNTADSNSHSKRTLIVFMAFANVTSPGSTTTKARQRK